MPPADGITVRQKSRAFFQRYRPNADIAKPDQEAGGDPSRSRRPLAARNGQGECGLKAGSDGRVMAINGASDGVS